MGHWWMNPISIPSSYPRGWKWEVTDGSWKFQSSKQGQAPPGNYLTANLCHLISINSGSVERGLLWTTKDTSFTLEIPRVLGTLCQELGAKDKYTYYLFIIPQIVLQLFVHLRTRVLFILLNHPSPCTSNRAKHTVRCSINVDLNDLCAFHILPGGRLICEIKRNFPKSSVH